MWPRELESKYAAIGIGKVDGNAGKQHILKGGSTSSGLQAWLLLGARIKVGSYLRVILHYSFGYPPALDPMHLWFCAFRAVCFWRLDWQLIPAPNKKAALFLRCKAQVRLASVYQNYIISSLLFFFIKSFIWIIKDATHRTMYPLLYLTDPV